MPYFGGLALSISLRSHSSPPAASYFAHCAGVRRIDRCNSFSSSGFGGRPPLCFGCSMAQVYVMQKGVDKRIVYQSQ